MQTTTNYGLKKPEQNEYISIDDLNFNADKIDEELKKKADESGGDVSETKTSVTEPADSTKYPAIPATGGALRTMLGYLTRWVKSLKDDKVDISGGDIANTKVSAITDSTASFPVPAVNDAPKTFLGKIKKWQQDCLAKFGNYVLMSMITNQQVNSTNNIPTSALVYAMQQAITQLNSDLDKISPSFEQAGAYPLYFIVRTGKSYDLAILFGTIGLNYVDNTRFSGTVQFPITFVDTGAYSAVVTPIWIADRPVTPYVQKDTGLMHIHALNTGDEVSTTPREANYIILGRIQAN